MMTNLFEESVYQEYLKNLLVGDKGKCLATVQNCLNHDVNIHDIYVHLFQRSMYEVGELWEKNLISVALEHLATSITESLLSFLAPQIFAAEHIGKKAIIACVANEYHQTGGRMVADIFELHGWDGYFLGANTPHHDLLKMIDEKKPDVVGLSLAIYFNLGNLLTIVEMIRSNYPNQAIFVGGQAFRWGGVDAFHGKPQVTYMAALGALETFLKAG